jgi:hypothetical protein
MAPLEEELEEPDEELEEQDLVASIGRIFLRRFSHQLEESEEQATGVGVAVVPPEEELEELDAEEEPDEQGVGVGLVFQSKL